MAPEGASEPLHRYNADEMGTSEPFQTATAEHDVADRKCEKPNNDGLCSGVADQKGVSGDVRVSCAEDAPTDQTCVQCRGEIDGTERLVSVSGRTVWLHHECERFWLRAVQAGER